MHSACKLCKIVDHYKTHTCCFPLHPTTAPWAKAGKEKQKVTKEERASLHFIQLSLSILALDAEQHMSI